MNCQYSTPPKRNSKYQQDELPLPSDAMIDEEEELNGNSQFDKWQYYGKQNRVFSYDNDSWYKNEDISLMNINSKYIMHDKLDRKPLLNPKLRYLPSRVLQMSELENDYYLNLIDIHGQSNLIGIAYRRAGVIYQIMSKKFDYIKVCDQSNESLFTTCLRFSQDQGNYFAISYNSGLVQCWDYVKCKLIRNLQQQSSSVKVLAWQTPYILTAAGKGNTIYNLDVRIQNHVIQEFNAGHDKQVSSLSWNENKNEFLSAGQDSKICLWNCSKQNKPVYSIENAHNSSIKGLSWSSLQSRHFITGGGRGDGTIKLWDCFSKRNLHSIETQSQVTNILCSKTNFRGYFMATSGNPCNQVEIWQEMNNNTIKKKQDLQGHKSRTLFAAICSNTEQIVTSSHDGQIKIWDCFVKNDKNEDIDERNNKIEDLKQCIR